MDLPYLSNQVLTLTQTIINLPTPYLLSTTVMLTILYFWPIWRRYKYSNGPLPLPFIGNALLFGGRNNPMKTLKDMRKQYGEVIFLQMGEPVAILNSLEAVVETLVNNADVTSERTQIMGGSHPFKIDAVGGDGLVEAVGDWKPLRRHALTSFKEQGVGKQGMEEVVQEETVYYLTELEKMVNHPVSLIDQLMLSISNIISHINFGQRFDYTSEKQKTLEFTDWLHEEPKNRRIPLLKYLGDPYGYYAAKEKVLNTVAFVNAQIAAHQKTIDYDNPRDYIDSFLVEKNVKKRPEFQDNQLLATLLQFYVAGTDTTSGTLAWAFLFAACHPEMQDKLYAEIQAHIGNRVASYSDRNAMHYTHAFLTEVFRKGVTVTSVPHATSVDIVVQGVTIPKHTVLLPNLWAVHHDEYLYPDSHTFKPERFLDKEGKFVKPDSKKFMPFGIGRRVCLGETLARTEAFIFLVSTLQHYKLTLFEDKKDLDMDGYFHFLLMPPPHKLVLTPRSN